VDGLAAGRYSSSCASSQYRALQQFFKWWAEEEELPDPMTRLQPPKVTAVGSTCDVDALWSRKCCVAESARIED
jgi:hypothetical protein